MRVAARVRFFILILILAAAVIGALLFLRERKEPEPIDPHAGQVYIFDGFDMVWMTPLEGVPVSDITAEDISNINGKLDYCGSKYTTLRGVDVSEHQWDIDWAQVAASGVDFAMIRACYRGYTEGGLFTDPYFERNIRGALDNGLQVGVYVFSQAVSVQEAMEEADYILDLIEGYDVTLPVVFDWEKIEDNDQARTKALDSGVLNDCAVAFCEKIKLAGKTPGLYFNRHLGYYRYDLRRMTDYTLWLSVPGRYPEFYYAADMWQYSFTEQVPGISEPVDMNLLFIPVPEPAEETPQQ